MIAFEEARKLVDQEIQRLNSNYDVMIYDEYTIEFKYGWVFFYNLVNAKLGEGLIGNGPFLIDKFTGEIKQLGTSRPAEYQIDEFEEKKSGVKNKWTIRLKRKIGFSKYFKLYQLNRRTFRYAKDIWPILNSYPNEIMKGTLGQILKLKYQLEGVGIEVIVLKNDEIIDRLSKRDYFFYESENIFERLFRKTKFILTSPY